MRSIPGLDRICGRRNVVKVEIKLLLFRFDFKQLCGSFNLAIKQRLDHMNWRLMEEILQAVRAALLVTELS